MIVSYGGTFAPSLNTSNILWPVQQGQQSSSQPNRILTVFVEYKIMTQVVVTAIIEWNIGLPLSSQIRQTSADRTDFAY